MYQKKQQLGSRASKAIRTFRFENNQLNIITDHLRVLRIWEKYILDLFDSENRPKYIAVDAKEELNEDDKGTFILQNEVVKDFKDMRIK